MNNAATLEAGRQSLIDHLDARFANGDIERALGGFALLMLTFDVGAKNGHTPDVPFEKDMLATIAMRLRTTLRDTDFLAQFDERTFTVGIPQISDCATAERIIQKLKAAFVPSIGNSDVHEATVLSLKIGFSLFPSDGATQQALVARAQQAT